MAVRSERHANRSRLRSASELSVSATRGRVPRRGSSCRPGARADRRAGGGREARFELCPGVLGPQESIEEAAMRRCALVYALFAAELLA